jgi:pantetheine-phosphate adenylyltransferase
MAKDAIFPGSFDPITLGHYDIVVRSLDIFDKVYVALGVNSSKPRFIPIEKSIQMIKTVFEAYPKVEVIHYDFLTVDLCKKLGVNFIVRGIRNVSDFDYERSLADMNRKIYPALETIFLDSRPEYIPISSTIIRDLIKNGADVSAFVPKAVIDLLKQV